MALDESNENDTVFEEGGFTYIIEKKLLDDVKPITVDYVVTPRGEGFVINTGIKADGCGSCSGC